MTVSAWRSPVPWLLLTVAAVQFSCAFRGGLTPWKGGGFGMFSSVDRPEGRFVAISAWDAAGRRYRVASPADNYRYWGALSESYINQTRMWPTQHRLQQIAEAVLRSELVDSPQPPAVAVPGHLARSRYVDVFNAVRTAPGATLQIVGARKGPASFDRIERVEVTVLRMELNMSADAIMFRPVGPVGSASVGDAGRR